MMAWTHIFEPDLDVAWGFLQYLRTILWFLFHESARSAHIVFLQCLADAVRMFMDVDQELPWDLVTPFSQLRFQLQVSPVHTSLFFRTTQDTFFYSICVLPELFLHSLPYFYFFLGHLDQCIHFSLLMSLFYLECLDDLSVYGKKSLFYIRKDQKIEPSWGQALMLEEPFLWSLIQFIS